MIDQPTDGAIFAGINLYLNGLRPRIWFEDVFVREHLTIRAVAVLASESEASDFATMAKYPGKAVCCEACSFVAFPAAGSHEHPMAGSLAQCLYCSCHENKMGTYSWPVKGEDAATCERLGINYH